jgi:2'-5' RNA ligase
MVNAMSELSKTIHHILLIPVYEAEEVHITLKFFLLT